jgi:signal transduction histidine kinase
VFDRFYRVPGSMARGSGLGLAIAQAAARRWGLRIRLRNRTDASGLVARVEPAGGLRSASLIPSSENAHDQLKRGPYSETTVEA